MVDGTSSDSAATDVVDDEHPEAPRRAAIPEVSLSGYVVRLGSSHRGVRRLDRRPLSSSLNGDAIRIPLATSPVKVPNGTGPQRSIGSSG
jgi:hypothetical protein